MKKLSITFAIMAFATSTFAQSEQDTLSSETQENSCDP